MFTEKQIQNFWKKVEKCGENECWNWRASITSSGYGQFTVNRKNVSAHRVAFFLSTQETPNVVRHICDNKKCCNPKHLVGGTHFENMLDMVGKERTIWKLTPEDVLSIRRLYADRRRTGKTQNSLAIEFGVSQRQISYIISGRSWKQLLPE